MRQNWRSPSFDLQSASPTLCHRPDRQNDLAWIPDNDLNDDRPYLTRLWSNWQHLQGSKSRNMGFPVYHQPLQSTRYKSSRKPSRWVTVDSCLLAVHQGKYSHDALAEQLNELSSDHTVHGLAMDFPCPPIPSFGVPAATGTIAGKLVMKYGLLYQIHLMVAHGSQGSFPNPRNEMRYQSGVGLVSRSGCHDADQ